MPHETGMLIQGMKDHIFEKELHDKITEVRKDKSWDEFWLIFQQKPDIYRPNVIRNGWTATNAKPHPISNTIQFYVNWKQGRIDFQVFPPDRVNSDIYNTPLGKGQRELDLNRKLGLMTNGVYTPEEGLLFF